MNANVEMLNYIYQNAQMGQETLNHIIEIANDEHFIKMLNEQLDEYKKIFDVAEERINNYEKPAKEISGMQKGQAHVMISIQTLKDKTPSHISEMLIKGSTMGVIQMVRKIRRYKNVVDSDILSLGERLLNFEKQNITNCMEFL